MKIAILGGSFDPPHKGHVTIANRLLKLNHFDEVWMMPCYRHPFNKNLSDSFDRFTMTKCLANGPVKVSDWEIKQKTINYTIDTLNSLAKKFPQNKFYWIIGTDQLNDFTKWRNWQEILKNFKLIIVPRTANQKGELRFRKIAQKLNVLSNIIFINKNKFPPMHISSTFVRNRLQEKKPISDLVPEKVEKYIIRHNLYQKL